MSKINLFFFCILLLATACTPKPITGLYDTDQPYEMSMTGELLELQPDQQFFYKRWSDDIDSNIKGKGQYEIKDKQLILQFADYTPEATEVSTTAIEEGENDSLRIQLNVQDHAERAIIGAPIKIEDEAGKLLGTGITNTEGNCHLELPASAPNLILHISYVGYLDTQIELDGSSQAIEVTLAERTRYFAADEVLRFRLKQMDDRLILVNERGKKVFYKR